jgi:hypothetical protein
MPAKFSGTIQICGAFCFLVCEDGWGYEVQGVSVPKNPTNATSFSRYPALTQAITMPMSTIPNPKTFFSQFT